MAFILSLYIILVRRYLQKFRVLEIQSIREKYTYFIIYMRVYSEIGCPICVYRPTQPAGLDKFCQCIVWLVDEGVS